MAPEARLGATVACVLAASALALPGPGQAQDRDNAVLRGSVSDHGLGGAIAGASVTLVDLDTEDERLGPVLTDEAGQFSFRRVPPGTYVLHAAMLGFQERQDTLALDGGTEVRVVIELSVSPVPLDPLVVEVVVRPPANVDSFDARRARLHGTFLDREAIEERFAHKISDLYMTVPSVSVVGGRPSNLRGGGGGRSMGGCPMTVYVDGVETDGSMEGAISPDWIEAMEVYTSVGQVPVQYRRGPCGAVLIWLREGGRSETGMERRSGTLWKGVLVLTSLAVTGLLWVF